MTLAEYLCAGFTAVNRKLHLVFLDFSVKIFCILISLISVFITWLLFATNVVIREEDLLALQGGISQLSFLTFIRIFLENSLLLATYMAFAVLFVTFLWALLEAFVRAGILCNGKLGFLKTAFSNFLTFFLTGIFSRISGLAVILFIATVTCGPLLATPLGKWSDAWGEIRWSVLAGVAVLCAVVFTLTVITTIIRGQMSEDFGDKVGALVGIIGSLVALEVSMFAFGAMLVFVSTRALLGLGGLISPLIPIVIIVLALSFLRSYLLLVRFASVDIMRRSP